MDILNYHYFHTAKKLKTTEGIMSNTAPKTKVSEDGSL